jgi:hypothetical protein
LLQEAPVGDAAGDAEGEHDPDDMDLSGNDAEPEPAANATDHDHPLAQDDHTPAQDDPVCRQTREFVPVFAVQCLFKNRFTNSEWH